MHIIASVFINDNERGLHQDYEGLARSCLFHLPKSASIWRHLFLCQRTKPHRPGILFHLLDPFETRDGDGHRAARPQPPSSPCARVRPPLVSTSRRSSTVWIMLATAPSFRQFQALRPSSAANFASPPFKFPGQSPPSQRPCGITLARSNSSHTFRVGA